MSDIGLDVDGQGLAHRGTASTCHRPHRVPGIERLDEDHRLIGGKLKAVDHFHVIERGLGVHAIEVPSHIIFWEDLDSAQQEEILKWSPQLRIADGRGFQRWALYEVVDDPDSLQ